MMFKKFLACYCLLALSNVGIFAYEWGIIGMTIDQSLFLRIFTLITDVFEALLFVSSNFFQTITTWMLQKINCQWSWAESGLKLALIGSLLYLIKMVLVDGFLGFQDIGITPIGTVKILFAFIFSFTLSFCWGAAFDLYLEKCINAISKVWQKLFST